jgi:hypothetical protein
VVGEKNQSTVSKISIAEPIEKVKNGYDKHNSRRLFMENNELNLIYI